MKRILGLAVVLVVVLISCAAFADTVTGSQLSVGTQTLTVPADKTLERPFVPSQSGYYMFKLSNDDDFWFYLCDSDDE